MEKMNFPTFQQALTMMMMNIFSKMTHLIEHNLFALFDRFHHFFPPLSCP